MSTSTNHPDPRRRWIARIGLVGFLFFLLKGLFWLAALAWGAWILRG